MSSAPCSASEAANASFTSSSVSGSETMSSVFSQASEATSMESEPTQLSEAETASFGSSAVSEAGTLTPSSSAGVPRRTPEQYGAIFLNFYRFLTTLHFDETNLKVPPAGGWPHMTREYCAGFKSDYTLDILRHLPYFEKRRNNEAAVHYKSHLTDYSVWTTEEFAAGDQVIDSMEFYDDRGDPVDDGDAFYFSVGRESFGRYIWLLTIDGEVVEEAVRVYDIGKGDVEAYFNELRESYRALQLIPCLGKTTIEADEVPEAAEEITVEQVYAQEKGWRTHLDVQYIRQVYRQHGWPDAFQKDQAWAAIDAFLKSMPERRGCYWDMDSEWYN